MKTSILVIFLVISCLGDEMNDRGKNAAQVANAGMAASQNLQQAGFNSVPYLTSNSYMSQAFSVIGGVLQFYHNVKMQNELKSSLAELNMRFDQLEDEMNQRFGQIAGYIDRKQFESDITDPTTILWGELQAYIQYPNNKTYGNIHFECMRQTAWQLAMKLHNRLYGPDNTLMTQIQANEYSNSSFMATKDVIMLRIFQLMMVQSFCLGLEHGPNYNVTDDWELSRMYNIYSALVNNTIEVRVKQETDYLKVVGPSVFRSCVTGSDQGSYSSYAKCIYTNLHDNYPWDHFGVIMYDQSCLGKYVGYYERISYSGLDGAGQGSQPYSVWKYDDGTVGVTVIRYWTFNDLGSKDSQYIGCMQDAYNNNPVDYSRNIDCGHSFDILSYDERCGKDTVYIGSDSSYFANVVYSTKLGVSSSAVWPYSQRPTTVAYDLGFWERPVTIALISISN